MRSNVPPDWPDVRRARGGLESSGSSGVGEPPPSGATPVWPTAECQVALPRRRKVVPGNARADGYGDFADAGTGLERTAGLAFAEVHLRSGLRTPGRTHRCGHKQARSFRAFTPAPAKSEPADAAGSEVLVLVPGAPAFGAGSVEGSVSGVTAGITSSQPLRPPRRPEW